MPLPSASILHHFATLTDPHVDRQKKHRLQDIFVIALCGVICGADNRVEVEEYGRAKADWFTEQLSLLNGIPSHDTFGAVFAAIDQTQFSECFTRWVADLATLTHGEVIAIDGKCLRRSVDHASKKAAIHLVSAWAQQNRLVLGQVKVDDKSNEIIYAHRKVRVRLSPSSWRGWILPARWSPSMRYPHGALVGCQQKIAEQIVRQGGDYVLSLKGNQGCLPDDVETYFQSKLAPEDVSLLGGDAEHGRLETRLISATDDIAWLRERHPWPGLNRASSPSPAARKTLRTGALKPVTSFPASLPTIRTV